MVQLSPTATPSCRRACGLMSHDFADDGAFDERAAPDVGRRVDDGVRRPRVLAQRDARREDGVRPDGCLRRDAAVVADERGPFDGLEVRELHSLPHPDVAAQLDPGDVEGNLLVEGVEVRLSELVEVADVLPVALGDVAVERATRFEEKREELLGEVERLSLRHMPKDFRVEDVDAGVDRVREDLAPRRLLEEAFDPSVLVGDDDSELERVVDALQADGDERVLLLVEADELAEIDVAERVPEMTRNGSSSAPSASFTEPAVPTGDPRRSSESDALALPRSGVAADRLRHEGQRDDDVVEAVLLQELDDVLHAWLADDGHDRLGLVRGERAGACPRHPPSRPPSSPHRPPDRHAVEDSRSDASATPTPRRARAASRARSVTRMNAINAYEHPCRGLAEKGDREVVAAAKPNGMPSDEQPSRKTMIASASRAAGWIRRRMTAMSIISRSASGSANLPNSDSTSHRRASHPSTWSVIPAIPKTIPAGQLESRPHRRRGQRTPG